MTIIEIPDDQAAGLKAKAAAQGLTIEGWLQRLAEATTGTFSSLDWSQCPSVESVESKLGGAWVFRGTRMPVSAVFENLEDGVTIEELLSLYDGLTREQVQSVLDFATRSLEVRTPAH